MLRRLHRGHISYILALCCSKIITDKNLFCVCHLAHYEDFSLWWKLKSCLVVGIYCQVADCKNSAVYVTGGGSSGGGRTAGRTVPGRQGPHRSEARGDARLLDNTAGEVGTTERQAPASRAVADLLRPVQRTLVSPLYFIFSHIYNSIVIFQNFDFVFLVGISVLQSPSPNILLLQNCYTNL